jgi:hypothetical protein
MTFASTVMMRGPQMPLFKFCRPEHNIHAGAQVQIGTLFKYRDIEDSELRDEAEGNYRFYVTFPNRIELDRRWTNLLLQGAIGFGDANDIPRFPGSFRTHIEKFHLVEHRGESVIVEDTRIRIERDVPNCLIFCMSVFPNAETNPLRQYADNWSIPEHLANEFSRRLGSLIFQHAKLSSFDESLFRIHSPATVGTLSLNIKHQRVIYRDREMVITSESKPSFDELVKVFSDIAFIKPTKYSPEQEYRFAFELVDGRKIFAPKVDHLLLNPNVLTSLE